MAGELSRAQRLVRAGKYRQAIRLLEPEVFRFRQSFPYFYLLGVACLYAGDTAGAASYIERARALAEDENVMVALAALALLRGDKELSLKTWLEIVERWPHNRQAKRGLGLLRRGREPSEVAANPRLLRRLFPRLPKRRGPVLAAAAAAVLIVLAAGLLARSLPHPAHRALPDLSLPATPLLSADSGALYTLSEREVRQGFERAKRLLLAYRDNEACVELNRLLLSNADQAVKERALMLKSYVKGPDFANVGRTYTWQEVSAQPRLYDGCYVLWRGRVANLKSGKTEITFDFLVGYERGTQLLGIVPASVSFAADLASGDNLEVIGRFLVGDGAARRLQITSLREIFPQ